MLYEAQCRVNLKWVICALSKNYDLIYSMIHLFEDSQESCPAPKFKSVNTATSSKSNITACCILIFVGIDISQHPNSFSKAFMTTLPNASLWYFLTAHFFNCWWLILKSISYSPLLYLHNSSKFGSCTCCHSFGFLYI